MLPSSQKRYSRNIALAEIGSEGQDILSSASVLVIGAGGLGSPVMLYLTAAGIGKIGIVDSDRVELSNLQRQILFADSSIGKSKTSEAEKKINEFNPNVSITTYKKRLTELNAQEIISQYDIIADCSDNFTTRFIINDTCFALKKTLVWGAATGFKGQVSTFKAYLGTEHPCYRCFCPTLPPEDLLPNCSSGGILGSVTGVIGSIQATEIIKELLSIGKSLSGSIIIYDALTGRIRNTTLKKNNNCNVCIKNAKI